MAKQAQYIPIDKRDPATVRAAILARVSDPSAADRDLESQVHACKGFIARMGWRVVTILEEKKTGYYQVRRPVLDEVERLIRQQQVDVIVCTEFARLSRDKIRRYAALQTARQYGVEYRFVNQEPDGKLPDTPEKRRYMALMEEFTEMERDVIRERTERGRIAHLEKRLPSAGRGGPPYGYQWKDTTHTAFLAQPQEAETLRWMFTQIDENEQASARWLSGELNRKGILTRGGKRWTSATVLEKLRNPIYCGHGRLLRWKVEWIDKQDDQTGEVYKVRHVQKRPISETRPISQDAVPVLIDPTLFERVQQKIDARRWFVGRLERPNSCHKAEDTLLHGGIVRCAHCGRALTRYWRARTKARAHDTIPYYRCNRNSSDPSHPCAVHNIPARDVDRLALHYIAFALTDPVKVVELADASDHYYTAALDTSEQTANQIAALQNRLSELDNERSHHRRVLAVMDPKMDAKEIEERQAKLARVADEEAQIEQQLSSLKPQQTRVAERAALLKALSSHKRFLINFERGTVMPQGEPTLPATLDSDLAYRLVGRSNPNSNGQQDIPTSLVLEEMLQNAPKETVRKLLRDMGVVVKVSRPDGRRYGRTPTIKRVVVEIFGDGIGAGLRIGPDEGNEPSFQQHAAG